MTDERDIINLPERDAPRERVAAALKSSGDPRGEFIAVQLELARAYRTQGSRSAWMAASARSEQLLLQHGKAWAPPFVGHVRGYHFRRGFVERVTLSPREFVARASELIATAPILHLDCVDGSSSIGEFCESAVAARLRSLDLRNNKIGDAGAKGIAASPHLSHLTWLDLYGNQITAAGLDALASSANLTSLRWLNLSGNRIEDPSDTPGGVDGSFIDSFDSPPLGRAIEAKYGPKPWLHWNPRDMLFWPPSPLCFISGE